MKTENILELFDGVYTNKYAYYSPVYRDFIKNKSTQLSIAFAFLHKTLGISKRTWMLLVPIRQTKGTHYYGYMEKQGNIVIDPRFDYDKNIETLSHEMWHVKQFSDGNFRYSKDKYGIVDGIVWKGHTYKTIIMPNSKDVLNTMELYRDQPWEKEAYENELLLSKLTKDHVARHTKTLKRLDTKGVEVYVDTLLKNREKL